MSREEAIQKLNECFDNEDTEVAHGVADDVLCDLLVSLGYEDVVNAYTRISKWYA